MTEQTPRTLQQAADELAATINEEAKARASEADEAIVDKMEAQLDARINARISRRLAPLIDAVALLLDSAIVADPIQLAFLKQRIEETRHG